MTFIVACKTGADVVMRTPYLSLVLYGSTAYAATNLTSFVNLFIGTASGANGGSGGNAFPGAAVPHAMAKVCCLSLRRAPVAELGRWHPKSRHDGR